MRQQSNRFSSQNRVDADRNPTYSANRFTEQEDRGRYSHEEYGRPNESYGRRRTGTSDYGSYDLGRNEGLGSRESMWGQSEYSGMDRGESWGSSQATSFRGKGPKNYRRSDERIREEVCDALEHHDRIDASDIDVTVKEGLVTLSGTIESRQLKRLIEDCAAEVRGVRDVVNNILVKSASPSSLSTPGSASTTDDDSRSASTSKRIM